MKTLFVYTNIDKFPRPLGDRKNILSWPTIHYGISILSACLKEIGCQTRLAYFERENYKEYISDCINDFKPAIVCFTSVTAQFGYVKKIANFIKKIAPQVILICGGIHLTLACEEFSDSPFDVACIGEGEEALVEFIRCLKDGKDYSGIENIWVKNKSGLKQNPLRPFLNDLDKLPYMDRKIWDEWIGPNERERQSMLISRGCPFKCTYCSNEALGKITEGKYVRFRSPENIISEIEYIARNYPQAQYIFFENESITNNLAWARDLCMALKELNKSRKAPFSFGTNYRIITGMEPGHIIHAMAEAGFKTLNIGIESGSEYIRRNILGRDYRNDEVVKTFKIAKGYGMKVNAYNIIGVPGETPEEFKKTIELNRICQPEINLLYIFYPYPGTALKKTCQERGLFKAKRKAARERKEPVLDLPEFPKKSVMKFFLRFKRDTYKKKRKKANLIWGYIYFYYIRRYGALRSLYGALRDLPAVKMLRGIFRKLCAEA